MSSKSVNKVVDALFVVLLLAAAPAAALAAPVAQSTELLNDPIVVTVLVAVVGLVAAYAGARLLPWLLKEKQGYPGEAEVEEALLPYLASALIAAYKLSEKKMDELGERLDGLDKKALADAAYALLPDTVVVGGKAIPVGVIKYLVPRERWEELVQDAFDRLTQIYSQNRAYFDDWFQKRVAELEQEQAKA